MKEGLDFLESIRTARAKRFEVIATLDCASCAVDSEYAIACKYRGQDGCKHQGDLDHRAAVAKARKERADLLTRADAYVDASTRRMIVLDELRPTQALDAVQDMLSSDKIKMLGLGGPAGRGKTTALAWAASRKRARFTTARRMVEGSREDEAREFFREVPLLLVNELGIEFLDAKGWAGGVLDDIFTERWDTGRPTIFVTNLAPRLSPAERRRWDEGDTGLEPQLEERYGDRFMSRLLGNGGKYVVCAGTDLRRNPKHWQDKD